MYIDPRSLIAGHPALRVRQFLRTVGHYDWTSENAAEWLGLKPGKAKRFIDELLRLGYATPSPDPPSGDGNKRWYRRTLAGTTIALASAARPMSRATADRKVREFLDRVVAVNVDDYYLYRVQQVLVFGSYLSEKSAINDIDLAVELVPREADRDKHHTLERVRIHHAYGAGRRFRNMVDEVFWPYHEVLLYLKARSRGISLHPMDDAVLQKAVTSPLFDAK